MAVVICPSCGGKVSTTRSTCIHCGYEFEAKKVCPECDEQVDANASECPSCGYVFNNSEETIPTVVEKVEKETRKEAKAEPQPDERYKKAFSYAINDDDTYKIDSISDAILKDYSEIHIPSEFNGHAVTVIGPKVFEGCDWITSISIPSTITLIEWDAFAMCRNIREVHITDLDAWRNIIFDGDGCSNPLLWGASLYLNGELVTDLVISDGEIHRYAFYECASLTSVTISDNITEIGAYAFCGCVNLANVTIGNGVTKIGCKAFAHTPLKSVTIPDSVTTIDYRAFSSCKNLNSVSIPDGSIHINKEAFYDCDKLSDGIHKQKGRKRDISSTKKSVRSNNKESEQNGAASPTNKAGLILAVSTFVTFIVAIAFLFTARVIVQYEHYNDGTITVITNSYVEAPFNDMDISLLCLITLIGTIATFITLLTRLRAEIKCRYNGGNSIIKDIIALLISVIPVVFSAVTLDSSADSGLLIFMILSSCCTLMLAIRLLLSIIKKSF